MASKPPTGRRDKPPGKDAPKPIAPRPRPLPGGRDTPRIEPSEPWDIKLPERRKP